jgi:hypothetical protein
MVFETAQALISRFGKLRPPRVYRNPSTCNGVDDLADSGVQLLGGDVALVDKRDLACHDARDGLGLLEGAEPLNTRAEPAAETDRSLRHYAGRRPIQAHPHNWPSAARRRWDTN